MKKKVLILGAGGFIGSHLVDSILKSKRVDCCLQLVGFHLGEYSQENLSVISGSVDHGLLDKCIQPDFIFCLIGGASVGESFSKPEMDFSLTVPAISALLNKIKTCWIGTKLIYLSSAAVYGANASIQTSFLHDLDPISPYGLHKKLAEELILFYVRFFDVDAVIIRPFSIYGPRLKKQLLWDALNKAQKGDFKFFGTGSEQRDWVYVEDLTAFLASFIEKKDFSLSRVINAGRGIGITNKEFLSKLLYHAGYQDSPVFIDESKNGDPAHLVSDFNEQKPYRELYNTDIDNGLKNYISWFRGLR